MDIRVQTPYGTKEGIIRLGGIVILRIVPYHDDPVFGAVAVFNFYPDWDETGPSIRKVYVNRGGEVVAQYWFDEPIRHPNWCPDDDCAYGPLLDALEEIGLNWDLYTSVRLSLPYNASKRWRRYGEDLYHNYILDGSRYRSLPIFSACEKSMVWRDAAFKPLRSPGRPGQHPICARCRHLHG